jgi:hypothetical protein
MKTSERTNRRLGRKYAALTLAFGLTGAQLFFGLNKVFALPPLMSHAAMPQPSHPVATPKIQPMPQHNTPPETPPAPSVGGPSHPIPTAPTTTPKGAADNKNVLASGSKPKPKPPPIPMPAVTTRPGGMPGNPGGVSTPRGGPIVATMPQIGMKELEHHHHHWHHWHHPTTDYGTGNTFSATNTYSPTIENSGNTNTENAKPTSKTDDGVTNISPKQVSKDEKSDPTEQAKGTDKNDNKDGGLDEAQDLFAGARASFKQGDYDKALEQVGAAIENQPNVASLHEFKALCYFAQRKYKEAAPVLYAVISAGPGWDMDTIKSFFPNQDAYLKQLDALKSFVEQQPDQAYGHFVLAYHYLTRGSTMLAKKQLQEAVRIQPDDKLSAALLKVL